MGLSCLNKVRTLFSLDCIPWVPAQTKEIRQNLHYTDTDLDAKTLNAQMVNAQIKLPT